MTINLRPCAPASLYKNVGMGNLIHKDYGKNAFTFHRRSDGKAARLVARPGVYGDVPQTLGQLLRKIQAGGLTDEEEVVWQ